MFHYYSFAGQPTLYFKFGVEGEKRLFFRLDQQNQVWVPIKIKARKASNEFYEYELEAEEGTFTTTLKEYRYSNLRTSLNLLMEITDKSQSSWTSTTCILSHITDKGLISFLSSKPQQVEKPQTARTENGRSNSSSSTFFHEHDRKYFIDNNKRGLLKAHMANLEKRSTDYSILSYICLLFCCFSQGFSKQEKITEITRLLDSGIADYRVVENGYTGSILSMT